TAHAWIMRDDRSQRRLGLEQRCDAEQREHKRKECKFDLSDAFHSATSRSERSDGPSRPSVSPLMLRVEHVRASTSYSNLRRCIVRRRRHSVKGARTATWWVTRA